MKQKYPVLFRFCFSLFYFQFLLCSSYVSRRDWSNMRFHYWHIYLWDSRRHHGKAVPCLRKGSCWCSHWASLLAPRKTPPYFMDLAVVWSHRTEKKDAATSDLCHTATSSSDLKLVRDFPSSCPISHHSHHKGCSGSLLYLNFLNGFLAFCHTPYCDAHLAAGPFLLFLVQKQ